MDRRRKVELFEQIRREYRFGVGTIRGVTKQFWVHRRIVRQALGSAIPPERRTPARANPRLGASKALRMPVIAANFLRLSEQAIKEQRNHIGYLEALLALEAEERDRHAIENRIRDAKLPRLKTLEEFDFNQARQIPAAKIRELAEGRYIERAEPVVLVGECGTGKTHPPGDWAMCSCVPPKTTSAIHHGAQLSQRTGRSPTAECCEGCSDALAALRRDRAR
jgi:hypothetical protein